MKATAKVLVLQIVDRRRSTHASTKMVINMLNSGADACMIDLEDSMAPSAQNALDSHHNIYKAVRGELPAENNDGGSIKRYTIGSTVATPTVRVRGLHMNEVHARA